jgi:hypothetical protein
VTVPSDKALISSFYDDNGHCHCIEVVLNYDGVTVADLTEAIRAVFRPERITGDPATQRDRELGSTEVIQVPREAIRNGDRAGVTMASIHIPRQRG